MCFSTRLLGISLSLKTNKRVGEVYARYENGLQSPEEETDVADRVGHITRIGSMALVVFSCVTFASIVLLPPLVHKPDDEQKPFLNDDKHSCLTKIWQQSPIRHLFLFLVNKVRPI